MQNIAMTPMRCSRWATVLQQRLEENIVAVIRHFLRAVTAAAGCDEQGRMVRRWALDLPPSLAGQPHTLTVLRCVRCDSLNRTATICVSIRLHLAHHAHSIVCRSCSIPILFHFSQHAVKVLAVASTSIDSSWVSWGGLDAGLEVIVIRSPAKVLTKVMAGIKSECNLCMSLLTVPSLSSGMPAVLCDKEQPCMTNS